MERELGKADWIYDDEIGHIPCCTALKVKLVVGGHDTVVKCGNGPLRQSEITEGRCEYCRGH